MHSVNHNKLSGEMHFEVVMFSVYISGSQPFEGQVSPTKKIPRFLGLICFKNKQLNNF